jgi:hypothetical protein
VMNGHQPHLVARWAARCLPVRPGEHLAQPGLGAGRRAAGCQL